MIEPRLFVTRFLAVLFLAVALLAGCASGTMVAYEGPAQSIEKIAVIKSAVSGFVGGMTATSTPIVSCIDGKQVTGEEIQILPSMHQIQISLFHQPSSRNFRGNLEFQAHANHEYLANGAVVSGQAIVWIEDKNTKQKVVQGDATDQSFKGVQCQ